MKLINFICKNLFFVALLLFATQCKDKDESQPLTMTLYDKPLSTIQSVVEGKWKWIEISGLCGIVGVNSLSNTIVNITKDRVVTTGDNDALNQACTFSYHWEKDSVQWGYTTYVMWNNEKNKGEWYFDNIQNDLLYIHDSTLGPCGNITTYLFKRIN